MAPVRRTLLSIGLVALLLANLPMNASALPTPGLFGEEAEAVTGRIFPEAMETNDYVGFFEAVDGLELLQQRHPGWVTIRETGRSYGLENLQTGEHDTFPVMMVEVTNPDSPVPREDKVELLFMLSIHGNEKGGREGGFRVIEDFATNKGMATWTTENGAGDATYRELLDHMVLLFLFPNADGWAHDEPEYLTSTIRAEDLVARVQDFEPGSSSPTGLAFGLAFGSTGCANGVIFYCRTNGRNVDLNREVPTQGWARERYTTLSEPESQGFANFVKENYHNIVVATDIHGMLSHDNLVLTMLPAGQGDPHEMLRSTQLAEMLKERANNDDVFAAWQDTQRINAPSGIPLVGGGGLWGGDVNDWGTVWDTIGYTDSGFNSDWFFQDQGLNVPGFGIELAYNHITFDSQYEAGMLFNHYHVHAVRQIVAVFMDGMSQDLQTAIEVYGTRTAVLPNPTVVTNVDDEEPLGGWAADNPHDDGWDYAHNDFFAAPHDYYRDLKPYLKDGDVPAVFDDLNANQITPARLDRYDNLIISGTAIRQIEQDANAIQAIRDWVESGGNLVLTDEGMRFLSLAGIVEEDAVDSVVLYAGYTNFFDRTHDLVSEIRGVARQLYEPVPIGFSIEGDHAPNWRVARDAMPAGSTALGWVEPVRRDDDGNALPATQARINTGEVPLGEGRVRFIGSLLPNPSEESYHPYGLASYATTYSGNHLLRLFLGWEQTFEAPPALLDSLGIKYTEKPDLDNPVVQGSNVNEVEESPMSLLIPTLALLGAVLASMRRRR